MDEGRNAGVLWHTLTCEDAIKLLETGLPPEFHARLRQYLADEDIPKLDRLFKRHSVNHRLRPAKIRRYRKAMKRNRFPPHTETIKISTDDVLRDGYNRLVSQVLAGVTKEWMIQRDVPAPAVAHLDTGAVRSAAESLLQQEDGAVSEANRMVATARVFNYLSTGDIDLDNGEVGQVFSRNRKYIELAVNECRRRPSTKLAAVMGAFAFSYRASPRKVEKLMAQIMGDRDRPPSGAALAIERLLEGPERKISRAVYSPLTHKILHAIRLHIEGANVVRLSDAKESVEWMRRQRRKNT